MTRTITLRDQENAQRLRAIWRRRMAEEQLTQAKLAKLLGLSPPTTCQYLSGKIALNTDAILKFALALKVPPSDIDPKLAALSLVPSSNRIRKVPILAKLSGNPPGPHEAVETMTDQHHQLFALSVDTPELEPIYRMGSTLIVCPDLEPITGDHVLIELATAPGKTINLLRRYVTTDMTTNQVVATQLDGSLAENLPLDQVISVDPIVAMHAPRVNRPSRLRPRPVG
ncbi:helix-turn-helix transcriptional regulator [Pseudomonas sp. RL]|uniref:helix-turn-helix domain-containing protein n=1 Tax=Pseudomonas sp. RL TaxID=1452718 RepID=UPI00068C7B7A|nr:helix-turn-helix transcriptional regulator [Pseudomonas sp. RL]